MKHFTIHPSASEHSDTDLSDDENWCTTTDTSIHSDLGSFLEDMSLYGGDVTDYDSDGNIDYSYYDDFDFDETTASEESDFSEGEGGLENEEQDSKGNADSVEVTTRVIEDQSDNASGTSTPHSSSYSSASELSDTEMLDDLLIEKPSLTGSCNQETHAPVSIIQVLEKESSL